MQLGLRRCACGANVSERRRRDAALKHQLVGCLDNPCLRGRATRRQTARTRTVAAVTHASTLAFPTHRAGQRPSCGRRVHRTHARGNRPSHGVFPQRGLPRGLAGDPTLSRLGSLRFPSLFSSPRNSRASRTGPKGPLLLDRTRITRRRRNVPGPRFGHSDSSPADSRTFRIIGLVGPVTLGVR